MSGRRGATSPLRSLPVAWQDYSPATFLGTDQPTTQVAPGRAPAKQGRDVSLISTGGLCGMFPKEPQGIAGMLAAA
jgi:hypothetical protein